MIRGFLKAVSIVLLFFSLLVFGISWNLSSSLSYNNVENNAAGVALNLLNSQMNITQQINSNMPLLRQYCQQNNNRDLSMNYQGYNITISCSDTNGTSSQLISDTLKNLIHRIYYKNYSCSYWSCFSSSNGIPLFLISQKSQEYWSRIFWYSLAASLIFTALVVLFSKKRESSSITIGIVLALGALPLLGIQKVISTLPSMISGISAIFFSQSNYVFWRMIIIAGALVIIGIILAILQKAFHIFDKIKKKTEEKEVKEIIKKERSNAGEKPKNSKSPKNSQQQNKK